MFVPGSRVHMVNASIGVGGPSTDPLREVYDRLSHVVVGGSRSSQEPALRPLVPGDLESHKGAAHRRLAELRSKFEYGCPRAAVYITFFTTRHLRRNFPGCCSRLSVVTCACLLLRPMRGPVPPSLAVAFAAQVKVSWQGSR